MIKNRILFHCLVHCLQGKLIKLYAKQLVTKSKLAIDSLPAEMRQYPSLQQWLRVVGLTQESIQVMIYRDFSYLFVEERLLLYIILL